MKFLQPSPFFTICCIIVSQCQQFAVVKSFSNVQKIDRYRNYLVVHSNVVRQTVDRTILQGFGDFENLNIITENDNKNRRLVVLHDLSASKPISYRTMWDVQKQLVDSQIERIKELKKTNEKKILSQFVSVEKLSHYSSNLSSEKKSLPSYQPQGYDSIIMLQHKPVYTLGTGSDPSFIKGYNQACNREEQSSNGIDVVDIERGGEVTYHGPGQLVAYPILDLRGYRQDIHWYIRALEEAIIIALKCVGVQGAKREDGVTGVWVDNRKIGAIGVKVRRWVTMHGLSVNVDRRSLANFDGIVPCGLVGRDVCCINDFLEDPITVEEFASQLSLALQTVLEVNLVP